VFSLREKKEIIKNPRFMPPKEKASEGKRKKIVKACKDCRRRKVRDWKGKRMLLIF
jgi:hypothetical protein